MPENKYGQGQSIELSAQVMDVDNPSQSNLQQHIPIYADSQSYLPIEHIHQIKNNSLASIHPGTILSYLFFSLPPQRPPSCYHIHNSPNYPSYNDGTGHSKTCDELWFSPGVIIEIAITLISSVHNLDDREECNYLKQIFIRIQHSTTIQKSSLKV